MAEIDWSQLQMGEVLEFYGPGPTPWVWAQQQEACPHPWRPQQQQDGKHYFVMSNEPFVYVCDGCGVREITDEDRPHG